jgi:transcription-repair coupling factor (superfamily II helicase)
VTTARATAERTRVPGALKEATLRLRSSFLTSQLPNFPTTLTDVVHQLEAMGYRRVPTVTEVAEFSVRGGIVDVYGFGMAAPARCEWWGDQLASMRGFDLTTQRSLGDVDEITVLPVRAAERRTGGQADSGSADDSRSNVPTARPPDRLTVLELLPAATLLIEEGEGADADEVERAWNEAAHHLELARRMGEEVPTRDELFDAPGTWAARRAAAARLLVRADAADLNLGFLPPERIDRDIARLRALLAGGQPTLILCDNEGQLERLEELLSEGDRGPYAALAVGALDGGFILPRLRVLTDHEIFRRARRLRRPRRYRQALLGRHRALSAGDYVVHWITASASTAGSTRSRWGVVCSRSRSSNTRAATG